MWGNMPGGVWAVGVAYKAESGLSGYTLQECGK